VIQTAEQRFPRDITGYTYRDHQRGTHDRKM